MAEAGRLTAAGVVNNKGLANLLVRAGVPYVIWRPVAGENDSMPATFGDERDIAIGYGDFRPQDYGGGEVLDDRVYVQIFATNEQNRVNDGYYWRGAFNRAIEVGRWRVAAFPDGVGNPGDFKEWPPNSGSQRYISAAWDLRVSSGAMRLGKLHGFLNTYHGYGRLTPDGKETADPASALWFDQSGNIIKRDDTAWFWYGGRALSVYYAIKPNGLPLIPEDSRMDIVSGEYRSSDAIFRTVQEIMDDVRGCDIRTAGDSHFKAVLIWCAGRGWKFAYSAIDRGLPEMKRLRLAQPA